MTTRNATRHTTRPTAAAPGLDLSQLLARLRPPAGAAQLPGRIRDHLDLHDGYVAFSGGKDSLVVLHLALQAEPNVPVVFFDSGLEFPETHAYLDQLQDRLNLQLHVVHARPGLLDILQASGGWDHTAPDKSVPNLHACLINRPAATAHESLGPGELWGVRAEESRGRAAMYATALRREIALQGYPAGPPHNELRSRFGGIVRRKDGTTAFGPVWNWKTEDVWAYIARHQLPINPVYERLRAIGAPESAQRLSHVLDGNHLERGRVTWLRRGWPNLYEQLRSTLPRIAEFV
jgi:phosphoadenosine phosphosulfate reductase